jgi:peroxiredoxin
MKWRGLQEDKPGSRSTSLKAALDERRALMEQHVPAESQALNRRVVEQLRQAGVSRAILPIGATAPGFQLPDQNGVAWTSGARLAAGPLVLLFFRGRWCPFDVAQLEAWNDLLADLKARHVVPAAISPQTVHQSSLMHEQHRLGFPLLSDAGNHVARQFGLVYRVPEEQRQMYSRTFVNLPFLNGDESWELPLPATYLVAQTGTVLYAVADQDYTRRPEPAETLAAL